MPRCVHREIASLIAIALAGAALVGACELPGSERATLCVATASLVSSVDVSGEFWSDPARGISPGGRYVLLASSDAEGAHLYVLDTKDRSLMEFDSASKSWLEQAAFSFRPLGWLDGGRFLYAKVGWQPDGKWKHQRGVAFVIGDLGTRGASEAAFIPVSWGGPEMRFFPGEGRVLLTFRAERQSGGAWGPYTTELWEFDARAQKARLVRADLPYDPYRSPAMAPGGRYVAYFRDGEGRGVFVCDTSTGEETLVLPTGQTRSFYPAWSPDVRLLAAYAANKKGGAQGSHWYDYDVLPGEDAAQAVASAITVVDLRGQVLSNLSVPGKYLAYFRWAPDSRSLVFLAGTVSFGEGPGTFDAEGIYIANLEEAGKIELLAEITEEQGGGHPWTLPLGFSPEGGVYYEVHGEGIWYVKKGIAPALVTDAAVTFSSETAPSYGDSVLSTLSRRDQSVAAFLTASECVEFAKAARLELIAYDEDKIVAYTGQAGTTYPSSGKITVYRVTIRTPN